MATRANTIMGAVTSVKIGGYAADAATPSPAFIDVGYTLGPVTIETARERFEIKPDQTMGPVSAPLTSFGLKLKTNMIESDLDIWRLAWEQVTTQLTGVPPDEIFAVIAPVAEEYYQVQFIGPGIGTLGIRTVTAWRCAVEANDAVSFGKEGVQAQAVTFTVMEDDSVTTLPATKGTYMLIQDT